MSVGGRGWGCPAGGVTPPSPPQAPLPRLRRPEKPPAPPPARVSVRREGATVSSRGSGGGPVPENTARAGEGGGAPPGPGDATPSSPESRGRREGPSQWPRRPGRGGGMAHPAACPQLSSPQPALLLTPLEGGVGGEKQKKRKKKKQPTAKTLYKKTPELSRAPRNPAGRGRKGRG